MIDAWMRFIAEKGLDVEITTFSVLNKRRYFIRIGSWNKLRHLATLPVTCWQNDIFPPKLRISGLTRTFAECVGHLNITLVLALLDDGSDSDSCSLMDDKESELEGEKIDSEGKEAEEKESEEKKLPMADCGIDMFSHQNLPDPTKFPLLHSLGVCTTTHMDRLMQEIIQFYGGKSITFTRGNNQKGTLAVILSKQTLQRYHDEFLKSGSALDTLVQSIADSTSSTAKDAASCLLSVLFSKYEDSFMSVAIEKCVMERHFPQKWTLWQQRPCYKRQTLIIQMQEFFFAI